VHSRRLIYFRVARILDSVNFCELPCIYGNNSDCISRVCFICGLFNDAVCSSGYIASKYRIIDEL
jgi:hypothetical protein